jgi:Tfp pilus assembly protein PilF
MRTRPGSPLLCLALAVVLVACATTPIGKAIQAADFQQKVVHEAAVQVAMIHLQGGIAEPTYAAIKKAYADWAAAQAALAHSLAAWKVVQTPENDSKVTAALTRIGPLAEAYLKLVSRWVDVPAIQQKVGG